MTVGTFLESYDLSGKQIYPISQSASMDRSQYEQSVAFIRECAKGADVDDGLFSKDNTAIQEYVENTVLPELEKMEIQSLQLRQMRCSHSHFSYGKKEICPQ